jgi:hypothetical protein
MHEVRLKALIKAFKIVLYPKTQHGSFVNNLPNPATAAMLEACYPDIDMTEAVDNGAETTDSDEEDAQQSPSHGDSSPSPTQPIEHSRIQYVQLPLPKNQGRNELNQDRQSGGRGGNHR